MLSVYSVITFVYTLSRNHNDRASVWILVQQSVIDVVRTHILNNFEHCDVSVTGIHYDCVFKYALFQLTLYLESTMNTKPRKTRYRKTKHVSESAKKIDLTRMRRDSTGHNTRREEGEIKSKIVTYTNENYSYEDILPADINIRFFNFVEGRHKECYDKDSEEYINMNKDYDRLSWFYSFTHLYIMYTQDNKTFTVHYEITPVERYDYDWNYSENEMGSGDGSCSDEDDFDNFRFY